MRREYIARQGRRSLAVLPVVAPREILTALDILAVELWGPPGPPRGDAAGRLQPYVCAVVRNALAFLAAGRADAVDGVLVPHTCDSLQGLAALLRDFGGFGKPTFVFQHARGADRPTARAFVEAELRSLAAALEGFTGRRLEPERLRWAIRLHAEIDATRAALLDARARLPMTDVDLYALLRRGEWLWPEEHLAELRVAEAPLARMPVQDGIPVLVTGYVPEPPGLLAALNRSGAFVAADDYAAVGRRIARAAPAIGAAPPSPREPSPSPSLREPSPSPSLREPSPSPLREPPPSLSPRAAGGEGSRVRGAPDDPWSALVNRYFALPPCPTRGADQDARMRHLADLQERSGARGVLVHVQKFCEPELFDVPAIRRTFAERGVPAVVIEGELERELSAQAETRLEAFVEMIRAARAA